MSIERDIALAACDGAVQGACQQYAQHGTLAMLVRSDGDSYRLIFPKGYEAELAKLLYRAADEMVSRIEPAQSKAQH